MGDLEKKRYEDKNIWKDLNLSEHNKVRIYQLSKMIPSNVGSLADIGCGNGLFLNYLKQQGKIKELIGVDFSEVALKEVRTEKKIGNITDIPLERNSYDVVCAQEVLEHLSLDDFKQAKKELSKVSKRYILVSVPFKEDLELEFVKCPFCKTRYNISHHKRSFSEEDIQELFTENGFECIDIKYISKRNEYLLLSTLLNTYRKKRGIKKVEIGSCPVCGYTEARGESKKKRVIKKSSVISTLKRVWPKRYKYKWISAIYEKNK